MTFDGWLAQQLHRQDPIGALARDAATDPGWPRGGTDTDRYLYLADIGATGDTQIALARAHREYRELPR
jgi:hypothetical protein